MWLEWTRQPFFPPAGRFFTAIKVVYWFQISLHMRLNLGSELCDSLRRGGWKKKRREEINLSTNPSSQFDFATDATQITRASVLKPFIIGSVSQCGTRRRKKLFAHHKDFYDLFFTVPSSERKLKTFPYFFLRLFNYENSGRKISRQHVEWNCVRLEAFQCRKRRRQQQNDEKNSLANNFQSGNQDFPRKILFFILPRMSFLIWQHFRKRRF